MCGRYELKTEFEHFPFLLRENLPKGFKEKYAIQELIRPADPVLVLKHEGRIASSLMLWGFVPEWTKNPFDSSRPRPFNARSETVDEKGLFRTSWKYKRCLLPASGFFEKGYRIRRKDSKLFWLAGIWNRWMNSEGSELDTCCVLTTKSNQLLRKIHDRMPVIIPNGLEEEWMGPIKDDHQLRDLKPLLKHWSSQDWVAELTKPTKNRQMRLF